MNKASCLFVGDWFMLNEMVFAKIGRNIYSTNGLFFVIHMAIAACFHVE